MKNLNDDAELDRLSAHIIEDIIYLPNAVASKTIIKKLTVISSVIIPGYED
jgi:hypothetical protein